MSIDFETDNSRSRAAIHTATPTPFKGVVCPQRSSGLSRTMYIAWEEKYDVHGKDGEYIDRLSREVTVFLKRDHLEALRNRCTEMMAEFDANVNPPNDDPSDPNGDGHGVY